MPRFTQSFLFVFALLLVSVERSPAPVMEIEMPTPPPVQKKDAAAGTRTAYNRADKKPEKRSPFAAFEGLWAGTVTSSATASLILSSSASTTQTVAIRVSATGVITNGSEQPVQGYLSADGQTLSWNWQRNFDEVVFRSNDSLRLGGRNVLIYSVTNATTGAVANVSGKASGTLYRK